MHSAVQKGMRSALVAICLVALLAIGVFLFSSAPQAHSQSSGTPVTGHAWSSNVGWISLSGSNYGLTINADNTVTGYAWGDHVGWISFNANSCGSAATYNPATKALSGWAKAQNGVNGDGCISLSGSNYGAKLDGTHSYAWASDTLGWIDFYYASVAVAAPTCTIQGPSSTPPPNTPFNLSYTTTNATGGTITGTGASCTVDTSAGTHTCAVAGQAAGTYNYSMSVTGSGGSGSCGPAAVVVASAAPTGCLSVGTATCSPAQKSVRTTKGAATTVYWSVSGVSNCTVTANGSVIGSGTQLTGTLTYAPLAQTTVVLSCDSGTFSDRAVINITPIFKEI